MEAMQGGHEKRKGNPKIQTTRKRIGEQEKTRKKRLENGHGG